MSEVNSYSSSFSPGTSIFSTLLTFDISSEPGWRKGREMLVLRIYDFISDFILVTHNYYLFLEDLTISFTGSI